MSSTSQVLPCFCVVCLKSIDLPTCWQENSKNSEKINTFIKFLTRFVGNLEADYRKLLKNNYAYFTCEECDLTIKSFCEIYNQIKCLELQLDLKLDKLVRKVKYSNTATNQLHDIEKGDKCQKEIQMIRQTIIKAGNCLLKIGLQYFKIEL